MPSIQVTDGAGTPSQVTRVTKGTINMASVYSGPDIVFSTNQNYDLTDQDNLNLETFLSGQGAVVSVPSIINIPIGIVVGSLDRTIPAVVTGDLSAYTAGVTLNVFGEIQGAGGPVALPGGGALLATSMLTVVNEGAIRGGGGGGGVGGEGGAGNDDDGFGSDQFSTSSTNRYYFTRDNTFHRWANNTLCWSDDQQAEYCSHGGFIYDRRAYQSGSGDAQYFKIRRATQLVGLAGAGGAGGLGQGHDQAPTVGGDGLAGTNRAGDGQAGGEGGMWGMPGAQGQTGLTGLTYTVYSANNITNGFVGGPGGAAGYAIDASATTIQLLGAGIVNGPVL